MYRLIKLSYNISTGARTLAVLTKIDVMDKGAGALRKLPYHIAL